MLPLSSLSAFHAGQLLYLILYKRFVKFTLFEFNSYLVN
ncbi:hypothetical protein FHX49_001676 [Microbacterium endophyticum]|uniref:Uncharacterized protein n=1 Tax=Microbacterium endophyticum TaxID=1526412 RepID=A0A7W4YNV9_9MICO|nr:hypothetical protein [Microbacterium endophyticum]NIK34976.1 hypothetical protein [Microbacterium endophyticum]